MFRGIGPNKGIEVRDHNALEYALDCAGFACYSTLAPDYQAFSKEFAADIIEWFYSGNWERVSE